MNALSLKKFALAASSFVAMGFASQAMALPEFTVKPLPGNGTVPSITTPFIASGVAGTSSELVTVTSSTTQSGVGYLQLTGFTRQGVGLLPLATGLGINYGLYVRFAFNDVLTSGVNGQPGSTYALTSLTFNLFSDPSNNNVYTPSTAGGTAFSAATVTDTGANDVLLGSGSLMTGIAGFNNLGGVFFNSIQSFNLTTEGSAFFISPVPFYTMAFTEFNNTTQGATFTTDRGHIAVNATGSVDFNRVPEPSSLALFGIAAVGLGLSARRNRNVAK